MVKQRPGAEYDADGKCTSIPEEWHGTDALTAYKNYACRCTPCRIAHAADCRKRREAKNQRLEEAWQIRSRADILEKITEITGRLERAETTSVRERSIVRVQTDTLEWVIWKLTSLPDYEGPES
jgi:hypothetical protein